MSNKSESELLRETENFVQRVLSENFGQKTSKKIVKAVAWKIYATLQKSVQKT